MISTTNPRAVVLTQTVSVDGFEQVVALLVNPESKLILHRLTRWSKRGAVSDIASWAVGKRIEIVQVT